MSRRVEAGRTLRSTGEDPVFRAATSPLLVLDSRLRMHAANPAYCAATLREADELLDQHVLSVFPDNPALGAGHDGAATLGASLNHVLRTGLPDRMPLRRYDVPARRGGDGFVERVWVAVNSPVLNDDGAVVGVLHHAEDVTQLLRRRTGTAAPSEVRPTATWSRLLEQLVTENDRLRGQFERHACIEQAKGILMAQRGCSGADAFTMLRAISQDTNTKLHVVAQALIDDSARVARGARPARRG